MMNSASYVEWEFTPAILIFLLSKLSAKRFPRIAGIIHLLGGG